MAAGRGQGVLGFALRMQWPDLAPFVRSLRAAAYEGAIVLWGDAFDATTRRELAARDVETIVPREWPAGQDFMFGRFHHYAHAIERRGWERVFLTDVRDVVFERDPFPLFDSRLFAAPEDLTLAGQPHNRLWIEQAYGADGLARVGSCRISCVGTLFGGTAAVLRHIAAMQRESVGKPMFQGLDMAVHNWLLHTGQADAVWHENDGSGPVWTIGTRTTDDFFRLDGDQVRTADGRLPAAIHQYDRHPALGAAVARRFGVR